MELADDVSVFAYGSNMDLADVKRWARERQQSLGRWGAVEVASLPDHRLVWNYHSPARNGGAANVVAASGCTVYGVVVRVCALTLAALDRKEGHPERYERGLRPVRTAAGMGAAWVYEVRPSYRSDGVVPPTRAYLSLLVMASERFDFPWDYREALRGVPTAD